jgi:tetratricopeptide (TPR) repeat protein
MLNQTKEPTVIPINYINDEELHISEGITFYSQDKFEEAIECFNKSIIINPFSTHAFFNKGNTLYALNQLDEARECYYRVIDLDPTYHEAFIKVGSILLDQARTSKDK